MVVAFHAVQQVSLALHLGHRGKAPLFLSPGLGLLQLSGAMKLFLVNVLGAEETCHIQAEAV